MTFLNVLGSIESFNEEINGTPKHTNDVDFLDIDTTEEMMDLLVLNEDINEKLALVDMWFNELNNIEHTIKVVDEHGWNKSLVSLLDPDGTLAEIGLVPSTESLEENVSIVGSTEGFKETMRKVWTAIKNAFKWIGSKLSNMITAIGNMFRKQSSILETLKKKYLEKIKDKDDINEDKYKKAKVKVIKAFKKETDFEKFLKDMETFIEVFHNEILNMDIDLLKKDIGEDEKGVKNLANVILKMSKEKVGNLYKEFEVKDGSVKAKEDTGDDSFKDRCLSFDSVDLEKLVPLNKVVDFCKKVDDYIKIAQKTEKVFPKYAKTTKEIGKLGEKLADTVIKSVKDDDDKDKYNAKKALSKVSQELTKAEANIVKGYMNALNSVVNIYKAIAKCRQVTEKSEED